MSDKQIPNAFEQLQKAEKKRGRPPMKKPLGEKKASKPAVGETKRKPVGLRKVSTTPTREGYNRRKVNDVEDRIHMFEEGGYKKVLDAKGNPIMIRAGKGVQSFLMEIDSDLYNSDQEAKYSQWNADCQERLTPRDGAGFYKPGK